MKKKKILLLIGLISVLVLSTVLGVSAIADSKNYVWSEINLSNELFAGDTFTVPTATVNDGEKDYSSSFVLKFPNGKSYSDTDDNPKTPSEFRLPYSGIYQLTYTANVNGTMVTKTNAFNVNEKLFSVTGSGSSVAYGTAECPDLSGEGKVTKSGLMVKLAAGDTFNYNKIVDLNEMPSIAKIIEFYNVPSVDRELDVSGITLILTDAYDETNKIEIKIKAILKAASEDKWDWTYLSACAPNAGQTTTGYAKGARPEVQVDTIYGAGTHFSFYGSSFYKNDNSHTGRKYTALDRTITVNYSNKDKTVYVGDNKVVDLDDPFFFSKLWDGFTSSKVLVSFVGNTYFKETANILIKELCGQRLDDANILTKDTEPEFTLDNNGVDLDNAITVLGYKFPVFNVTAVDAYDGKLPVTVKAFNGYYSTMKNELDIVDGYFIANKLGVVTLEYSVVSFSGRVYTKLIDIFVKPEKIMTAAFSGDRVTSGKAGDIFDIADFAVENNVGKVENVISVYKGDVEIPVTDGSFKATSSGEYKVKVVSTDIIGQEAIGEYTVMVSTNNKPVFYGDVILPKYLIVGKTYKMPSFTAYDYSSETEKAVESKVKVNGTETTSFKPTEEGDVTVQYVASTEGGTTTKSYTLKAVSVTKDQDALDYGKYFANVRVESKNGANDVSISAMGEYDGKATFINYLSSYDFSVEFVVNALKDEFDTLDFYLRDVLDEKNYIKVSIDHKNYKAFVNGNDVGCTLEVKSLFDTTGKAAIKLSYDERVNKISIGGQSVVVEGFKGFYGNLIYLDVALAGVEGEAEVAIRKICNQVLKTSMKKDTIAPIVSYNGEYEIYADINTELKVYRAVVTDVLNPIVEYYLTVITPNGYAVASDGTVLNKVSSDRDYTVTLDKLGTYIVEYYAKDAAGKTASGTKSNINVIDKESPTITIVGEIPKTAKVGDKITVPTVTLTDNVDTELEVVVIIYNSYSGLRKVLKESEFEVTIPSSKYIISYICMDKAGNVARVSFTVEVGEK